MFNGISEIAPFRIEGAFSSGKYVTGSCAVLVEINNDRSETSRTYRPPPQLEIGVGTIRFCSLPSSLPFNRPLPAYFVKQDVIYWAKHHTH